MDPITFQSWLADSRISLEDELTAQAETDRKKEFLLVITIVVVLGIGWWVLFKD